MFIKEQLINFFVRCFMQLCRIVPIENKVVFCSFAGKIVGDNPKAIYDVFRQKYGEQYKYIWLVNDAGLFIPGATVVKYKSLRALYHLGTALIWIDNARKNEAIIKRNSQFYIQTWHGNVAGKKVERDVMDKLTPKYVRSAQNDSKMADIFLSGSKWCSNKYRDAFWYDGKILEFGLPRSDIFYKSHSEVINKVHLYFNENKETRFVLYAPTFRANNCNACYLNDFEKVLSQIQNKWSGKWKLIIRLHPNVQFLQDTISYNDNILNGSLYEEINELIIASDVLITDYSSCMFDAMEAGKTVFIYAPDVAQYQEDRGMYFSLEELPFSVADNYQKFLDNIAEFVEEEYRVRVEQFKEEICFFNCDNSSEKIVDYIIEMIGTTYDERTK